MLGIIDQPILKERWLGVHGRPTTLNGKEIKTRACADVAKAYLYATTPHMFGGKHPWQQRGCKTSHRFLSCWMALHKRLAPLPQRMTLRRCKRAQRIPLEMLCNAIDVLVCMQGGSCRQKAALTTLCTREQPAT